MEAEAQAKAKEVAKERARVAAELKAKEDAERGCAGSDLFMKVPPGTVVRELHTQKVAGELVEHEETLVVARGGRGGRGNAAFKTQRYTAPKIAKRGEPGAERWLSLELRLVADVGFLGMPNAGKAHCLRPQAAPGPKLPIICLPPLYRILVCVI